MCWYEYAVSVMFLVWDGMALSRAVLVREVGVPFSFQ